MQLLEEVNVYQITITPVHLRGRIDDAMIWQNLLSKPCCSVFVYPPSNLVPTILTGEPLRFTQMVHIGPLQNPI